MKITTNEDAPPTKINEHHIYVQTKTIKPN